MSIMSIISKISKMTNSKEYYDLFKQTTKLINTLPYRDCKYCIYYSEKLIKEESICYKFGKAKEEKNSENFYTAVDCRENENKCGSKATYYISKLLR